VVEVKRTRKTWKVPERHGKSQIEQEKQEKSWKELHWKIGGIWWTTCVSLELEEENNISDNFIPRSHFFCTID
jgi:hypothetical protein